MTITRELIDLGAFEAVDQAQSYARWYERQLREHGKPYADRLLVDKQAEGAFDGLEAQWVAFVALVRAYADGLTTEAARRKALEAVKGQLRSRASGEDDLAQPTAA